MLSKSPTLTPPTQETFQERKYHKIFRFEPDWQLKCLTKGAGILSSGNEADRGDTLCIAREGEAAWRQKTKPDLSYLIANQYDYTRQASSFPPLQAGIFRKKFITRFAIDKEPPLVYACLCFSNFSQGKLSIALPGRARKFSIRCLAIIVKYKYFYVIIIVIFTIDK